MQSTKPDVTQSNQAEEGLRHSEERLRLATEAAGIGTFTVEIDSQTAHYSPELATMLGFPEARDVKVEAALARIHRDDVARATALYAKAIDPAGAGRLQIEMRFVRPGGEIRWMWFNSEVKFRGDGPGRVPFQIVGACADITARKSVEQELASSQAKLTGLIAVASDAIISVDQDQRITLFNHGAESIFGYTSEEIMGQQLDVLIPHRSRAAHRGHVEQFGNGPQASRRMGERGEIFVMHKDGSEFPAEASISRFDMPTGPVFTAVVRDSSERKNHEQHLERLVEARTRELKNEIRQREAAQTTLIHAQRMEAFGQLASGIAHDFNNLLTIVTGNNELLEKKLTDDTQRDLLKLSTAAAESGVRLVARMLTFARQKTLEPVVLNLNDQVVSMAELLRRSVGEHISLATILADNLWFVQVDPSEIENVILNLAINARDAMPTGGEIAIETANCEIDADHPAIQAGLVPGEYVRLLVVDTGSGMTPNVLRRATEPFFTTKQSGKGTGLGLATSSGAIIQSGGVMTIDSVAGQGTTIAIFLPRAVVAAATTAAAQTATDSQVDRGETVLVVEDNPQVRALTINRLESLGYTVMEADSGPAAINVLEYGDKIDLVFSDMLLAGGMTGYDLARRVRQTWPKVKILLTSGFVDSALEQTGAGMQIELLAKPYKQADLARAVRDALSS